MVSLSNCLFSVSYLSFGHELRTGMVNKQVIGKGRVGGTWGGEETPFLVARGLRGLCTGERINQWGEGGGTVSGGSLEPHCLRKVFTCIHHAGARHTQAPSGHLAGGGQAISPSDGDSRAQFGPLCKSVQCGLLFTVTKAGEAHPRGKPGQPRQPSLPQKLCWLWSVWEPRPGGLVDG